MRPATLAAGDYVLTPTVCVERKSVADLYGSFKDGRIVTQVDAMCRLFATPVLLVEFDEREAFELVPDAASRSLAHAASGDAATAVSPHSIFAKLSLLVLHFPRLRIVWSRTAQATAQSFVAIKRAAGPGAEPDANALNVDATASATLSAPRRMLESLPGERSPRVLQYFCIGVVCGASANCVLWCLSPLWHSHEGVNSRNANALCAVAKNMRELVNLSHQALQSAIGRENGTKLYEFINHRNEERTKKPPPQAPQPPRPPQQRPPTHNQTR